MADIRFDGQTAIVTGAGGGLGRCHALELARRGANVVVNDLGPSFDGSAGPSEAAYAVVEEIKALGGTAIANGSSVADDAGVQKLIDDTMAAYGRIDIIVANAGILRDKSFPKLTMEDFEIILDVHLMGTIKPFKAAWEIMKTQNYGRLVVTTSSSGMYGNFGQTNYGAAKMGLFGLMNSLKIEGAKYNIKVNAVCPVAATAMTEALLPPPLAEALKPEYVTPGVINLVKEDAPTGMVLSAAAGGFSMAQIRETRGAFVGTGDDLTAEAVAAKWDEITDTSDMQAFEAGAGHTGHFFELFQSGTGK